MSRVIEKTLPEGWLETTIENSCEILDKLRKPISQKNRTNGEYPYYGATGIVDYINNYIFDERLVLVGEDGAKWERGDKTGFIAEGKYWVNNHAHVLRVNEDILIDKWLVNFLCFSDLSDYITGTTVPKLNQAKLKSIEFPLPPLKEQKRIVAKIDTLFAKIDKAISLTENSLKQAENLLPSVLKDVFEKGKVEGWEEKKLTEICERIFAGGDKPKDYFSNTKTDECSIPIFSNGIKEDGLYGYTKEPKVIKPSVTISARGTIGHTVYRTEPFVPIVRLIVLTPNQEIVSANFLMIVIKNLEILNVGSAIPQLTVPMIKNYSVLIPNQDNQDKISDLVGIYETKITQTQSKLEGQLAYLKQLKSSILSKAFKGEL